MNREKIIEDCFIIEALYLRRTRMNAMKSDRTTKHFSSSTLELFNFRFLHTLADFSFPSDPTLPAAAAASKLGSSCWYFSG